MGMKPENDKVFTDTNFAKRIIDYFDPQGICYEALKQINLVS
jgi:hypothetical protein